jgi:hypothetical protein
MPSFFPVISPTSCAALVRRHTAISSTAISASRTSATTGDSTTRGSSARTTVTREDSAESIQAKAQAAMTAHEVAVTCGACEGGH